MAHFVTWYVTLQSMRLLSCCKLECLSTTSINRRIGGLQLVNNDSWPDQHWCGMLTSISRSIVSAGSSCINCYSSCSTLKNLDVSCAPRLTTIVKYTTMYSTEENTPTVYSLVEYLPPCPKKKNSRDNLIILSIDTNLCFPYDVFFRWWLVLATNTKLKLLMLMSTLVAKLEKWRLLGNRGPIVVAEIENGGRDWGWITSHEIRLDLGISANKTDVKLWRYIFQFHLSNMYWCMKNRRDEKLERQWSGDVRS